MHGLQACMFNILLLLHSALILSVVKMQLKGERGGLEAMRIIVMEITLSGFIRVREMSGKFKFFQGQRIVREFYAVSVKNEVLLKCQGNVREFYKLQFVSSDEKQENVEGSFPNICQAFENKHFERF